MRARKSLAAIVIYPAGSLWQTRGAGLRRREGAIFGLGSWSTMAARNFGSSISLAYADRSVSIGLSSTVMRFPVSQNLNSSPWRESRCRQSASLGAVCKFAHAPRRRRDDGGENEAAHAGDQLLRALPPSDHLWLINRSRAGYALRRQLTNSPISRSAVGPRLPQPEPPRPSPSPTKPSTSWKHELPKFCGCQWRAFRAPPAAVEDHVCRACPASWGCKSPVQPDGCEARAKRKGCLREATV